MVTSVGPGHREAPPVRASVDTRAAVRKDRGHGSRTRRAAGLARGPDRRRRCRLGVLRPTPGSFRSQSAGGLRDLGASWVEPRQRLQRGPHRGDDAGDRRVPRRARRRRAAADRPGHPRAVRAGLADSGGGAARRRRDRAGRRARRLHSDARGVARHPAAQPRGQARPGRRDRRHAVAQPTARRWLQVQPAPRRTRRLRRDRLDPGPGQRAARRRRGRGQARLVGPGPRGGRPVRLPVVLHRRPPGRARPRRDPFGRSADRCRPDGGCERRLLG